MTSLFLNKITDDFKERLLKQTRQEVFNLFKNEKLSTIDRANIEMLFVQPLFYSKLESFFNVWLLQSETSVEEVLKSTTLTDDDKNRFFSIFAGKLGIAHTEIKTDAAEILNKIFINSGNIVEDASLIVNENQKELVGSAVNTKSLYFNSELAEYVNYSFYVPMLLESFQTDENISSIFDVPFDKSKLTAYPAIENHTTYLNNALLIANNNLIETQKEVSLNVKDGDNQQIKIEGYIANLVTDFDYPTRVNIAMKTHYGFGYNEYTIYLEGPVSGDIKYSVYTPSANLLASIKEKMGDVDTRIILPNRIDCSITLETSKHVEYFKKHFAGYKDYNTFFEDLRFLIIENDDKSIIPVNYQAKVFVNPLVYKEYYFNVFGVDMSQSKILSSIPEEAFIARISDIYVKDTNEHITL